MNPEAQEFLDNILKKTPEELNDEEVRFLRARSSYLKKSQLEEYKNILKAPNVVKAPVEETEVVSYPELLRQAKELGYTGKRLKRPQLEEFIKSNQTQKNPFN